jgi:polyribonucleotide nucleotidyltransferase
MLGAVMFGHKGFQPVIEAIIELAEKAAKEPRDLPAGRQFRAREGARELAARTARRLQETRRPSATPVGAVKAKVKAHSARRAKPTSPQAKRLPAVFKEAGGQDRPLEHPRHRPRASTAAT